MARSKRGWRFSVGVVVAALAVPIVVVSAAAPASALTLPSGFNIVTVPTGLSGELTNMIFLPDGTDTMLVLGKCGEVRRVTQTGNSVGVTFNPLNTVNCESDRGLVGLELAPDFASSRQVWLSYNYTDSAGKAWGRVSRLTANSATAPTALTGETVVLDQIPSFSSTGATCDNSHTVGTLLFAPDGTLFVGDGDASSYCNVDNSALGAQDLTTPRGKILRINPNGSGVASNPFYDPAAPTSWKSRVFAYGFRNPFRFSLKPGTSSTLYVGDVGWNTYEEIDIANGGENFGWPCWEGPASFRNGYDALSQCQALYASPPANLKAPLYFWNHFNAAGDAAIGGVIYQGSSYPADYQGAYFFADYAAGQMWTMRTNGSDAIVRAPEANGFGTSVGAPVAFRAGPNGDVFFADIGSSSVKRLRYAAGNRAPVAVPTADKLAGNAPLAVAFDGSGSFDLDDEPITYAWAFGDGGTSTAQKPSHTFTGSALYTVRLTVTDQLGATGTATLTVNTRNNPPVLTVNGPPAGTLFAVGDPISITASATDAEDGPLPPSAITIQQIQHHCPTPGNCHLHPGAVTTAPASGPFTTVMPDHGDDSYLELVVTATDSAGSASTQSLTMATEEHNLSLSSTPAGVSIVVNGTNSVANPVLKEVAGSQNRLIAPATSGNLVFVRWSDGVTTPDRTITMPHADLPLVAQYNSAPIATASATPSSGPAPLTVQLSGSASDPDGDGIAAYAWAFGDGATGTGATTSHTYAANGTYTAALTVTDSRGATGTATATVAVGVVGTPIPAPPNAGWQVNSRATLSGSSLILTPNVGLAAGSAFWRTPVPSANLSISFDATIDQGNGADGMTLALANAATATPTAVGAVGGGLGFAGIQGVAIALDTWQGTGEPSSNFVGIAPGSANSVLTYAATANVAATFRNSTHHVDVTVVSGRITVKIDGTQRLDATVAVPPNVLIGFTAGTGGATDRHTVSNVVASYGGAAPPPPPAASLSVTPTSLAFGSVAVGATSAKTFAIANTGGSPLTVTSVSAPTGPFTLTGTPAAGATIAAGQSVTVTVTLQPTQAGTWSSPVQVVTSAGSATVALSGTTPTPPTGAQLSVSPTTLAYGAVAIGAAPTKTFAIANTGGSPLTVSSVGAPAAPFTMTGAPAAGATIAAGQSVTVTVTLRPTQAGTWSSSIPIATSVGPATVSLTGSTTAGGGTTIPAPWAGGWQVNGSATISGTSLIMTPNVGNAAGTAFWPTAVATANLRASFDITIDQGNGADGASFILGNPAAGARSTSIGGSGGALAAAGISGVAVTFDTFKNGTADVSANFIGVARTGSGLVYANTATNIPALRNSTHHIDIAVTAGHLTVAVDGVATIDSTVALPTTALVGFGASTGGLTDRHMITNAVLSA